MTSMLEHDISSYLRSEANRAVVRDELDDIESGTVIVPVAGNPDIRRHPLLLASAAVLITLVVGIAVVRGNTGSQPGPAAGSQAPGAQVSPVEPTAWTEPPTTNPVVPAPPTLATVSLPDGARFQGIAPSCTTADYAVYECAIPAFPDDVSATDMRGYTNVLVDNTSHVSGGCRSTSVDATELLCYVGQRAVDEGIVGADYLGEWSPQGYTAG